ncbi:hypothetical protein [Geomesophilobacter sediminis]|uniref:Uncharacterized protein n=1 Tax=Geomesophilobacter sediminis TaxID=2798584 RepID=A0A8J7IQF1_9BACT|nr:hypothetical protein [Geomesophilobacter sediminis]MBJ6726093.1 hypothetical protein [Geomesophilobacter sediminis]
MMLYLYVRQNQWIVVTILTGVSLMILMCLIYHDMWRARGEESVKANTIRITGIIPLLRWLGSFVPWAVLLVFAGDLAYTILHVLMAASQPPNW